MLATVVLVAVGAMAVRNIDGARVLDALQQVRGAWIVAALCCFSAILPLWAVQWTLLAPPTAHNTIRRMLGVTTMMSSTMNTTPLFLGEAAGLVLLVSRIGVTRAEAVSITIMDQLLVGVAKIGVVSTAALSLTVPDWMRAGWTTLAVGVVGLLVICALSAWQHARLGKVAARVLPPRTARMVGNIARALEPLWSPRRGGLGLLLALAKKLAEILAIVCVQRAFGVTLPFASAILVLAALNLATLLPVVPGNIGVYEGAVVLVYTRLGLSTDHAVSIAIVQHACYFAALAVPGYCWAAATAASRVRAAAS
ncbi:MAG: flippase-like domain-containing protein [Gemmatimonadota bacterium]|nr:flippase-like domain-containing protein [Gemmatimonadota bacterium]